METVTDQLDRTEKFYTEVLGFAVKARDRIERSGLGVPIDLVYLAASVISGTLMANCNALGGRPVPPPGQGVH